MNRRFVNLLVNNLIGRRPTFNLHRIDPASLFRPTGSPKPADPAASGLAPAQVRLPPAAVSFSPQKEIGWMDFLALKDDVIAVDHEGRTLLYDGEVGAVRVMNPMIGPRCGSISLPLGDDFFVMARELGLWGQVHHCQVLSFKDWIWYPLKPLTFNNLDLIEDPSFNKYKLGLEQIDPFELRAYTALGDSKGQEVWISTVGAGTYSFGNKEITWSKIGDWALPFSGRAHYVAEHALWFGFSDEHLCAADLRQDPPALPLRKFPLLQKWEEEPLVPEAWTPTSTSLFPLGSGKLCITRCFRKTDGAKLLPSDYRHENASSFAVLTGVEVVEHADTGGLQIIKHNSVSYSVGQNMVRPL